MNNTQKISNWIVTTLRESAWAPLGVILFYLLGLAFGWYDTFPPLDIPTHFLGGVAITYFYRCAIRNSQKYLGEIPLLVQILLAFTATGTTTIFWEFYEYFLDSSFGAHNIRGVTDTIVDFITGLSGALVLSLFYRKQSSQ